LGRENAKLKKGKLFERQELKSTHLVTLQTPKKGKKKKQDEQTRKLRNTERR